MQNYFFTSDGTKSIYKLSGGDSAVSGGIVPAPADFNYTSGGNTYKITYLQPVTKTPPQGFGSLKADKALPRGNYDFDYDDVQKIATLSLRVAGAAPATPAAPVAPAAPATPAAPGGGSPGGSGSSSSVAASDASDLQRFLAANVALYFDKVDKKYTRDKLDKAILSTGGFGPASREALAGFVAKIKERIPSSAVKVFTDKEPIADADALTENSSPEDLKFAWVATHPAGKSGFEAAAEIGFNTKITSGQFATAGTPLRQLYDMLALSPAPFVVVTTPIPAGARLITSDGQTENIVSFPKDFSFGAILGIGMDPADSAQVYTSGEKLNTDVHGPVAKAVLASDVSIVMQLVVDGKTYYTKDNIGIGKSVTFGNPTAAAAAASAAPVADAMSLSGESRLQMNTSLGVTVGGTRPGFILENVYMTNSGAPAMNSPQVILKKRTGSPRDVFELSVSNVSPTDILIPIIVKQQLTEAANPVEHWAETILATLTPAAAAGNATGIPHVALKQITWGYEEHYRRFGQPDVGNIQLVSYEPSDSGRYPQDVNVISVAEARAVGRSAESKWDPIDYAIAMYIGGNDNLVGTRLYTSSQLNRVMNSFPDARFGNG